MEEKVEFISIVKDNKGFDHPVFVMKVKTADTKTAMSGTWKRVFRYGNLTYPTMKEVKEVINSI